MKRIGKKGEIVIKISIFNLFLDANVYILNKRIASPF